MILRHVAAAVSSRADRGGAAAHRRIRAKKAVATRLSPVMLTVRFGSDRRRNLSFQQQRFARTHVQLSELDRVPIE